MTSIRFRQMRNRIGVLARRLPKIDPIGAYSDRQIDAVLAYRLLAHAEIEAFIEDIIRDLLKSLLAQFYAEGRIGRGLLATCSVYGGHKVARELPKANDLEVHVSAAVTAHFRTIANSNGIKEKDLLGLLLPVGIRVSDLDPVWLADMNTFGGLRGDTAHRSIGSQRRPDPASERSMVKRLVSGLGVVDSKIPALLS